MLNSKYLIA